MHFQQWNFQNIPCVCWNAMEPWPVLLILPHAPQTCMGAILFISPNHRSLSLSYSLKIIAAQFLWVAACCQLHLLNISVHLNFLEVWKTCVSYVLDVSLLAIVRMKLAVHSVNRQSRWLSTTRLVLSVALLAWSSFFLVLQLLRWLRSFKTYTC